MDYSSFSIVYGSRKLRGMPLWSLCICQRFSEFRNSIVTSWELVYRDLSSDQACQFAVFRVLLMAPWISWCLGLWCAIYNGMQWALTFPSFLVAQILRKFITFITILTKLIIIFIIFIITFLTLIVQQKRLSPREWWSSSSLGVGVIVDSWIQRGLTKESMLLSKLAVFRLQVEWKHPRDRVESDS